MQIRIKADCQEMAIAMGHQLNYLIEQAQETGMCIATFSVYPTFEVVKAEIHKTKTGYSISAWKENQST